jgi:hypothetical protein
MSWQRFCGGEGLCSMRFHCCKLRLQASNILSTLSTVSSSLSPVFPQCHHRQLSLVPISPLEQVQEHRPSMAQLTGPAALPPVHRRTVAPSPCHRYDDPSHGELHHQSTSSSMWCLQWFLITPCAQELGWSRRRPPRRVLSLERLGPPVSSVLCVAINFQCFVVLRSLSGVCDVVL